MRFLPENIGFATFLKCACSSALFTAWPVSRHGCFHHSLGFGKQLTGG